MKNLAIVTSTRAEYGLLQPVIKRLREYENYNKDIQTAQTGQLTPQGDDTLKISLIVTGTHLSQKHGMTIDEIRDAGVRIDEVVEVGLKCDTPVDIARNQADVLTKFTELFVREQYTAVMILGDRYEIQMVAVAATNAGIPIFHLCGGDTTEGAVDEAVRHSVTKMSYLHFVTNEGSRRRVIQLGEEPERVFDVGSTGVDNILHAPLMDRKEALASVGLGDCRYALGTYHPVTLEAQDVREDIEAFVEAIRAFPQITFIITKANVDRGGDLINSMLEREASVTPNLHVFASLGMKRYLSLMKSAEFVIGNSSSGIAEAPSFCVPTVNIGDRQRGRLQAESTINCQTGADDIKKAIETALSDEFRQLAAKVKSPYGDGNASQRIARIVLEKLNEPMDLKKKFYECKEI
jgi:GDP/UDP-N,N'-diacetylbacillosamine 2-epimerase (hydrolysing)